MLSNVLIRGINFITNPLKPFLRNNTSKFFLSVSNHKKIQNSVKKQQLYKKHNQIYKSSEQQPNDPSKEILNNNRNNLISAVPEELTSIKVQNLQIDQFSMTPHEYFITQGRNMERPYTGHIWYEYRVGHYHCTVCDNQIFSFDDKFDGNNGMGTYWRSFSNQIEVVEESKENKVELDLTNQILTEDGEKDKKQVLCKKCHSFLGVLFFDGPRPTFLRHQINSASVKFKEKPYWNDPNIGRTQKRLSLEEKRKSQMHRFQIDPEEEKSVEVEQLQENIIGKFHNDTLRQQKVKQLKLQKRERRIKQKQSRR